MSNFTNEPKEINKKEEEIYKIIIQKKEINDRTPKLRREEENKVGSFQFANKLNLQKHE